MRTLPARGPDGRPWLIVGSIVAGLAITAISVAVATQESDGLAAGTAPSFTLPTSDGGSVSLEAMRGHPVLLYFSEGVGCDSCFAQMAEIETSSSEFSELGVHVVPIMVNAVSDVVPAAAGFGLKTPIALDTTKSVSGEYGVLGTGMHAGLPGHSFILIDQTGTITWEQNYPSMYVSSVELLRTITDHLD
ncbi:MAG: redoxin domain-containing protein [Actinomycetota bacterium]